MSTNELDTVARDLKELRLMAEQLDAEIKALEDAARQAEKDAAVLEKYRLKFEKQKARQARRVG